MAIQHIHKCAILKLINSFTTTSTSIGSNLNINNNNNNNQNQNANNSKHHQININNFLLNENHQDIMPNIVNNNLTFDEPQTLIDLSVLTRLGYIISKFEQYFRPNSLIINGNISKTINQQNFFYLQQITILIQSIENNNLLKIKLENDIEQQQQSLQHVQMLILLIRDWILQFYLNKNFIHELFPSTTTNEGGTIFTLTEIKENNIIFISLLIFNIFYRLRNSFTEYSLLLEFSWICFTELEPYINLANFDQEYIYNMLQSSLLTAHIEEEQDQQINSSLYKQIDVLNNKICESKKRLLSLDATTSSTNIVGGNKQQQHQQQQHLQAQGQQIPVNYNNSGKSPIKNIHHQHSDQALKSMKIGHNTPTNHRPGSSSSSSSTTLANLYPGSKLFHHSMDSMNQSSQQSHSHHHQSSRGHNDKSNDIKLNIHSGMERPYKCDVCLKTFPTSYKLNRHSYSHSGERPYMCTWPNCDKRFNDNYHLRRHMNTHTGEKPYPCKYPDCPKRYSRSEDLRNHQKTHCIPGGISGGAITNTTPQQQQQQMVQQQSMSLGQQQPQQSTVSSLLLQQQQASSSSNNLVQQLVRQQQQQQQQQQTGISMPPPPSSSPAKSGTGGGGGGSGSAAHPQQQQQSSHHHRMVTDAQLLNQLQQHMQQSYSSSVSLQQQEHHQQQPLLRENTMVSSPPNQQGSNQQQQQQRQSSSSASMQPQHLNENYF